MKGYRKTSPIRTAARRKRRAAIIENYKKRREGLKEHYNTGFKHNMCGWCMSMNWHKEGGEPEYCGNPKCGKKLS